MKRFTNSFEGSGPFGGLVWSDSTLYGTTAFGGSSGFGTVFKVNTDGSGYTVIKSFAANDGAHPRATLTLSGSTLYGTTEGGGSAFYGTVFKVNTDGSDYTVLKNFTGRDGASPAAGLVLSGSTLYGTTSGTGSRSGAATMFKLNTDGSGYAVLANFVTSDGRAPVAPLTLAGNTLYGMTQLGGSWSDGTVFKVNTDGSGYTLLKNFSGPICIATPCTNSDGLNPVAGLTLAGRILYGTTPVGGESGNGTVFKVNIDGSGFSMLKNFAGSDGASPQAGLALAGSTLYGTTSRGGSSDNGTVFKLNTDGSDYAVLKNFTFSEGALPEAGLILSDSTLYGTTTQGGSSGYGTVFKIDIDGSGYAVLKNFSGLPGDGANPRGPLTLSGSTLYGTTSCGGSFVGCTGDGTVFQVNVDGSGFTLIKDFAETGEYRPYGSLTLSGTTLYGTTVTGGLFGDGTVFQVNTDGSGYAVLKNFARFTGSDGSIPRAGLTLSGNTLYGTAYGGGSFDEGVVFAINLAPSLSVSFTTTNTVAVCWPSLWTGFVLQENTDLSTANWSNVTATIRDDGTTKALLVNPPTGNRFYRLINP